MIDGRIVAIYIARAKGAAMEQLREAQINAGQGIVGDRYFTGTGTFSGNTQGPGDREITLIEAEEIDRFNAQQGYAFNHGELRRNIITRGVRLNELIDKEFQIGPVRLKGIRLCEPCAHLAGLVAPQVVKAMVHRAGLRACILTNGMIRENDPITG